MNKQFSDELADFLVTVKGKEGDAYSLYAYEFCARLLCTEEIVDKLLNYYKSNGGKKESSKLLSCIHPDKHMSSILSDEMMKVLSDATVLVRCVRPFLDESGLEHMYADLESIADLSRRFGAFSQHRNESVTLKEIESYYFTVLYYDGRRLTKKCQEAIIQNYYNVFVYVMYWSISQNPQWVDENLLVFKGHVALMQKYYYDKPGMSKLFEKFLNINDVVTTAGSAQGGNFVVESEAQALAVSDEASLSVGKELVPSKDERPVDMFRHVRTGLLGGLSVGLFAVIVPVSWSAVVGYGIFRLVLTGAKMFVDERHESALREQEEYYSDMLVRIKQQYCFMKKHVDEYFVLDNRRRVWLETLEKNLSCLKEMLLEDCKVLEAQGTHDHVDQLILHEIKQVCQPEARFSSSRSLFFQASNCERPISNSQGRSEEVIFEGVNLHECTEEEFMALLDRGVM